MSDRTLWVLATVSRAWPWEARSLMADVLGSRVARARDEGIQRVVLVHGAYGLDSAWSFKHDPPRSDAIAYDVWVREWGFEQDPHPADFAKYGRAGGPIRNAEMVQSIISRMTENPGDMTFCDAFIVNGSSGASGTADLAERAGILTKRHDPGKVVRPPRTKTPSVVLVPRAGGSVPVKPAQPVDPARHQVPNNVPGPCGRCGRVSYLVTDNLLYHGDGFCVYWNETRARWEQGCGKFMPLQGPVVGRVVLSDSRAAVLPVGQAASGGSHPQRRRRAS